MRAPGYVTPSRHRMRPARDWAPRLSAILIVEAGTVGGWSFRLTDRATHLELALLRLAYGAQLGGEDSRGLIVKPRDGLPMPTPEGLANALEIVRRSPRGR